MSPFWLRRFHETPQGQSKRKKFFLKQTRQIRKKNERMEKMEARFRRLKTEMEEISEEQKSIREGQKQVREKLQVIERECKRLKEETKLIMQQRDRTHLRLALMFNILKARREGDSAKASHLTRLLREMVPGARKD